MEFTPEVPHTGKKPLLEIQGEGYWHNPIYDVDGDDQDMLRLWRRFQDDMGGIGALPETGGLMDQVNIMTEAFDVMSAADSEARKE